jgi:hypothetical protein
MTEMKLLCGPIPMMELEGRRMLVEPTEPALASGLFNQLALHLPTSLRHRSRVALRAPEAAVWTLEENGVAVLRAPEIGLSKTCFPRGIACFSADRSLGLEV